ncbi:putative ATP-dependent permease ADP1 [Sugiyamaella lignohabitans]|uniref:Putative ATP-dependent permease ADP1 n=1 Tax=Sugiyamaella lignohabitans TaxID=796027 RepID=A0A167EAH0_9ASCO|nr:putative ATP-dependent permease ADP1 [Sugiyamaella lignohabitans]ANB13836.1 putative ATP-dependent permease ADP1 [Sugiyamaella lignohabitans]
MCNVTNRKILDILAGKIPQVTFSCNSTSAECDFQFWVDQVESFYCGLSNCTFETEVLSNTNITKYQCPEISCKCVPERMLCGEAGSIDISDFLTETISGPGFFECDRSTKSCKFSEPSMNDLIKSVFGDPYITLECDSSECLHYTELPGYLPPEKSVRRGFVLAAFISALVFILGGAVIFQYFMNRSQNNKLGYLQIPSDSDAAKLMANHQATSLQFEDISYSDKKRPVKILDGVFGQVKEGSVLAIMGGSGAGKTTLLDILASKTKRGVTEGHIYVNGREVISKNRYKKVIGFVDQEDCLIPTLTVYETIVTSALLRLPKSMSDDAKKLRALETMNELGILGLKDQLVGNETNRGISGGEKRRVAIACELVTSPSILFLDEPTSGLDAYNAFNVISSLVHLARNYNRTVVFTIHQPRSNIVAQFDELMLLAKGSVVYSGPQSEASNYFAEIGYPCPSGYNMGDFLIDLAMEADNSGGSSSNGDSAGDDQANEHLSEGGQSNSTESDDIHNPIPRANTIEDSTREWRHYAVHRNELSGEEAHENHLRRRISTTPAIRAPPSLSTLVELYKNSPLAESIRQKIQAQKQAVIDADESNLTSGYETPNQNGDGPETGDDATSPATRGGASSIPKELKGHDKVGVFGQFRILSGRTFKNLYRNPMLLLTHYVMAVLLAVFCGVLYFNVTNDISGFQNRLGLFFFLLALFGFSTLTTLQLFAEERIIFIRERANGYYHPIAYYLAKVMFDIIPLRVFPPILLGLIVYPLVGLSTDGYAFLRFLLILVLFNLTAASTCLLIGIMIQNTGVASLVGCLVMLFSLLFAGLFLNQDSMPAGAVWFKYISIFHYAYEALTVNEVRYLTLTEKKFGLSIEVPGATILSTFGFDSGALWDDVAGLAIVFGLFLIAGYVAMHFFLVERR